MKSPTSLDIENEAEGHCPCPWVHRLHMGDFNTQQSDRDKLTGHPPLCHVYAKKLYSLVPKLKLYYHLIFKFFSIFF